MFWWNGITSCYNRFDWLFVHFRWNLRISSAVVVVIVPHSMQIHFQVCMSACQTRSSEFRPIMPLIRWTIHTNLSIKAFIWYCFAISLWANWNCHPLCGFPLYVSWTRITDETLISTNQHTHIHMHTDTCTRKTYTPNDANDNWFMCSLHCIANSKTTWAQTIFE